MRVGGLLRLWVAAVDALVVEFLDALEGSAQGGAGELPLGGGLLKFGWQTLQNVGGDGPLQHMGLVVGEVVDSVITGRAVARNGAAAVVPICLLALGPRGTALLKLSLGHDSGVEGVSAVELLVGKDLATGPERRL